MFNFVDTSTNYERNKLENDKERSFQKIRRIKWISHKQATRRVKWQTFYKHFLIYFK